MQEEKKNRFHRFACRIFPEKRIIVKYMQVAVLCARLLNAIHLQVRFAGAEGREKKT